MKPPIRWWGGKQTLAPIIARLVESQPHIIYVEPFAGSAAVLFGRRIPAPVEILNDKDGAVVDFWRQIQQSPTPIIDAVNETLYAQATFTECKAIMENPDKHDQATVAFAVFFCANSAYGSNIDRGQLDGAVGVTAKTAAAAPHKMHNSNPAGRAINKKTWLLRDAQARLQRAVITNEDALKVIARYDDPQTFMYIDPPYLGTKKGNATAADQGHYRGYTEADGARLRDYLANLKGKFVLSEYPHPEYIAQAEKRGWTVEIHDMDLAASTFFNGKMTAATKKKTATRKQECLIYNFPPPAPEQREHFIMAGGKKIKI